MCIRDRHCFIDSKGPPSHCRRSMSLMEIQVPPGSFPGSLVTFQTPDGAQFQAQVPPGVMPGMAFQAQVPAAEPAPVPEPVQAPVTKAGKEKKKKKSKSGFCCC
eukprot:NODE_20193_length_808_cov_5.296623.p3 GENE.NODE_20193_length_808_cov_5.296623~~NODE_20193_length_808_cov_5.296623.p3  ORF type:complete len:104 (+),score=18.06 NODE_20193_length_808_cov_5.296623:104-415(+)